MRRRQLLSLLGALSLGALLLAPAAAFADQQDVSVLRSRNWAGYIATHAYYTGVSALIQVPTADSAQQVGVTSSWIGVGGAESADLIQAGVDVINRGNGPRYHAWVEALPQASHQLGLDVNPGDLVLVDIHEIRPNLWQGTIVDGQQVYQRQVWYVSSHSSVEWIVEAPSLANGLLLPLADVSGASFSKMSAIANGIESTPQQLSAQPVVLVGPNGGIRARPSALGPDGASFSVTIAGR